MTRPRNYLEFCIYEYLSDNNVIAGGDQEKVARLAAGIAKKVQREIHVDVDIATNNAFIKRANEVIQ